MTTLSWLLLMIAPLGLAQAQAAVEKLNPEEEYVICRNRDNVRTIRVDLNENQCVTLYTKAGVDREVGRGMHVQSCTRILENIRTNLEGASWKCREVQNASFTSTSNKQ